MSELKQDGATGRSSQLQNRNQHAPQSQRSIIPFVNPKKSSKITNIFKKRVEVATATKKKDLPSPKLAVSLGTLMEIEKWVAKARAGTAKYAFSPIMEQIRYNGDVFDDVIHSITLAQIMPYKEMKRHIKAHDLNPMADDFEFTYGLSQRYKMAQEDVVERIYHVRKISRFLSEYKKRNKEDILNGE